MRKLFLNSFRPLISTRQGKEAQKKYDLAPFIDGSIRREPDFENCLPTITGLCRVGRFVPRVNTNDKVIYITTKGNWLNAGFNHWRLVAVLEAIHRKETHQQCVDWYIERGLKVPCNCIVEGSQPLSIDMSVGSKFPYKQWEGGYQMRAKRCGTCVICKPLFIELYAPPIIKEEMMQDVFGCKNKSTQTPPAIRESEFDLLLTKAGVVI